MTIGIWILGNQLWLQQAALATCKQQKEQTPIILIESHFYSQQRLYHYQKLVLVWSAMRHFAEELQANQWPVTYEIADDFETPLNHWIKSNKITEVRVMTPTDRPFSLLIKNLQLACPITFVPNNHFLWSSQEFKEWTNSRKRLLMEDFYREGRKRFNILMKDKKPVGGQWNFDKYNRKPPKQKLKTPPVLWFEPDQITQTVIDEIKQKKLPGHGSLEPFRWGVTRGNGLAVLDHFINHCLDNFGPYQDAMITGEKTLWHSLISPYLNLGLLTPIEVIKAVEKAYHDKSLPLNSIEGLIRQVLGWREYMHGIYHYQDDDYAQNNWFYHTEPLPQFYWDSSKTNMNCLSQVLQQVEETGYGHHIQRLMVLSNFALIFGVNPSEIENWFHCAFIDAYDWVMVTNVIGMGQFADGGILASKPYASSANYINKMSDYCSNCVYNHRKRTGENACPFNFLYWNFLFRHQQQLKSLGRMNLVLSHLSRMEEQELNEIQNLAEEWRKKVRS